MYPHLFLPFRIGSTFLKNRIVGLPVYTGYAYPNGQTSDMMIDHYSGLARSGASIIVVANAAVEEHGLLSTYNLRIDNDECIPGLKKLSTAIKSFGAIACLQLNHAGKFAKTSKPMIPCALDASNVAFNLSSLKDFMEFFPLEKRFGLTQNFLKMVSNWSEEMTGEEKERIKHAYVNASIRALEAGFEGIELHGANGYLLCQFLSGFTNRYIDNGPKSYYDRLQFPLDVIREIKCHLPDDVIFGYRIILEEWVPDGIDLEESLKWAKQLQGEHISYLSASAGTYNSMFAPEVRQRMKNIAYLSESIRKLKAAVSVPVIAAGRIIHPAIADQLIRSHTADLVGLGRPLRTDRDWIEKARKASTSVRTCVNCNWCLKRVVLDRGFNCRRWTPIEQQKTDLNHRFLSLNFGSIWVLSTPSDITIYKNALNRFLPPPRTIQQGIHFTALFIDHGNQQSISGNEKNEFIQWANCTLQEKGFHHHSLETAELEIGSSPGKAIGSEVSKGAYGTVFLCRNDSDQWRVRIPYRIQGKVVGILGTSNNQDNVLVPVDMSATAGLILSFIRRYYHDNLQLTFRFVHVLANDKQQTEIRWQQLATVAGYDIAPPLEVIPLSVTIPQTILGKIHNDKIGTVIMGKRSMSMIKRWLLGTTSAAVLDQLTDQSVFIVE